jgi:SAM-dependent methyltransferase
VRGESVLSQIYPAGRTEQTEQRQRVCAMNDIGDDEFSYSTTPPAAFEGFETYDVRETDFYDQLANAHPGLILELGCGTGLHVRRLAERNHAVVGLELAPHFVEAANQIAAIEGSDSGTPPRFVVGDMRSFEFDEKFTLIFITCGTFYHLLSADDQIAMLGCARRHLSPDGIICTSLEIPTFKTWDWERGPGYSLIDHDERRCRVGSRSFTLQGVRSYNSVTQVCSINETISEEDGAETVVHRRSGLFRFTTPSEMELLCRLSGLKIVRRYRDYDGEEFLPEIPNSDWAIYLMRQA